MALAKLVADAVNLKFPDDKIERFEKLAWPAPFVLTGDDNPFIVVPDVLDTAPKLRFMLNVLTVLIVPPV